MASISADDGSHVEQHFWGMLLGPKNPFTLSLTLTELQITQATLVGDGPATLYASTQVVDALPLCVLGAPPLPRSSLLDLNFFPEDESVTLIVKGSGSISIAGTIAIKDDIPEDPEEAASAGVKKGGSKSDASSSDSSVFQPQEEEEDEDEEDETLASVFQDLEDDAEEEEEEEEEEGEEEKKKEMQKKDAALITKTSKVPPSEVEPASLTSKRKRETQPKEEVSADALQLKKPAAQTQQEHPPSSNEWRPVPGTQNKVQFKDVRTGGGEAATKGSKVVVGYKGSLKSGRVFDESTNFSFFLMKGDVIKGWDFGVSGMRVGGIRELIIHPDFGCKYLWRVQFLEDPTKTRFVCVSLTPLPSLFLTNSPPLPSF